MSSMKGVFSLIFSDTAVLELDASVILRIRSESLASAPARLPHVVYVGKAKSVKVLLTAERDSAWESLTYLIEGRHGTKLNDAVEPTEEDRDRPKKEVDRVASEVRDELDDLRKDHPNDEDLERESSMLSRPSSGALVE